MNSATPAHLPAAGGIPLAALALSSDISIVATALALCSIGVLMVGMYRLKRGERGR